MEKTNHYIVILAGGGGTRLWPLSRQAMPKQFLKLIDHETLLQTTFERAKKIAPEKNIYVVTSQELGEKVHEQLPLLPKENILIEPKPAGTAAAAALAAAEISKRDRNAVISTLASDHYIKSPEKFFKALRISQEAASSGDYIVTIGLAPTFPHTGLGYINSGKEKFKINNQSVFEVDGFTEKPDKATASAYIASKEFFWNANINSYKATNLLEAVRKYKPDLSPVLEEIASANFEKLWSEIEPEPIDTAILEKARNVLMVPAEFGWFDVGDWGILFDLLSESKNKNVFLGSEENVIDLSTKGSLVYAADKLIATVGVEDLVIVDTPEALLVAKRDKSQDVKKLVEELKKKSMKKYL